MSTGAALGLQAPLNYQYEYEGLAMTGIEAKTGQAAITGLRATVTVVTDDDEETTDIQVSPELSALE